MTAIELNEELAASNTKGSGKPNRNPLGYNNPMLRLKNRDIKRMLVEAGNEPCGVPGYESLSKLEYTVQVLWDEAMLGNRWCCTLILNRIFGRVPLSIEMDLQTSMSVAPVSSLTDTQLLERLDQLRAAVVIEVATEAESHPPDEGAVRGGD